MIIHFFPCALFNGTSSNPDRKYSSSAKGNPKFKPSAQRVKKLLWKRSLGLKIDYCAKVAGWTGGVPARRIIRDLGLDNDIPRSKSEVRASAISDYVDGGLTLKQVAEKYGFGITSVSRWLKVDGVQIDFSARKAQYVAEKPTGKETIGKKGLIQTTKGGEWIPTDSTYEYARVVQLESDKDVVSVSRCRSTIKYEFDGKLRTYTPDLVVVRSNGTTCIEEIKPNKWVNEPIVLAKKNAAIAQLSRIGATYRIVTEDDIGTSLLNLCAGEVMSRCNPEYISQQRERRLAGKRLAQRKYLEKMAAKLS